MGQGESGFSGCRLDLPQLSPAWAGFLPRLPTLPLACFLAPYPPSPLPPAGKGGFLVFLCKGLRPLHPRGLNPGGTYRSCHAGHPAGAGFLPRLPILPLACFLAPPIPLPPFPRRGRGGFLVFLCKGLRSLHPRGLNPGGTYSPFQAGYPTGACLLPRLPTLPLACFLAPIPLPLPGGKALGFPPTTEDTDARQPSATPTQINATPPSTNNIY